MKLVATHRPDRSRSSGQILTEAVIGLSLLSLVWILVAFTTFMATNHLRTAMAARYAAWYRGEAGRPATREQVTKYFFYHDLAGVEYRRGVGMLELYADLKAIDRESLSTAAHGPPRPR